MIYICKITGSALNSTSKVYEYTFKTVLFNKAAGPASNIVDTNMLSSGAGLKAVALCELGRDMTDKDATIPVDSFAALVYSGDQFYIIGGGSGLLDVWYSKTDDAFYKTLANGEEEEWAKSTEYPPAN